MKLRSMLRTLEQTCEEIGYDVMLKGEIENDHIYDEDLADLEIRLTSNRGTRDALIATIIKYKEA